MRLQCVKAPSDEGAVTKGDWGRDFSPSVFCFAKSTSRPLLSASQTFSPLTGKSALVRGRLFVGKSYGINIEAEKTAFEQGRKHRQNGHKNPATSIVAAFADMGG